MDEFLHNNTKEEKASSARTEASTLLPQTPAPEIPINKHGDSIPEIQEEAGFHPIPTIKVFEERSRFTDDPGYKQCKMSETVGTSSKYHCCSSLKLSIIVVIH